MTRQNRTKSPVTGGEGLVRLRVFGDPVLRQAARPVSVFDERLEHLARCMVDVMVQEEGVGLAANQVGVLSRLIVWRLPDEDGDCHVYVNPVIVESSETLATACEGCLSVPGTTIEVPRAEEVVVEAQDLRGQPLRVRLAGMAARIVQHEVDHLDGRLILDRATPEERARALRELRERVMSL